MHQTLNQADLGNHAHLGSLGIVHLKRFWARRTASRLNDDRDPITPDELRADDVLLAGLKVGIRETLGFLYKTAPTFEDFQGWVLAKNGGHLDSARVRRLNDALTGERSFELESILAEPVLSAADLSFWDEHGYVVVKNAVPPGNCQAAAHLRNMLALPAIVPIPGTPKASGFCSRNIQRYGRTATSREFTLRFRNSGAAEICG